jgi:cell division protein FtsQ
MSRAKASSPPAKGKSTSIKRSGRRPVVKAKSRKSPSRIGQGFSKLMALVPIKTETIERGITLCTIVLIGGAAVAAATFAGLPGFVGEQMAHAAGRAGFKVRLVEVVGVKRMEALNVHAIALKEHSTAMPLVDLARIRNELMQYSWIEDARVSRRLPDTLVVDIVERKPAAVWQNKQRLSLVDEKGVVLERVDPQAMPDLPIVIGDRANGQVASLGALLENVPALKPALGGATWVGNRRWDLRFKSGETLSLPEGEDMAAIALAKFQKMDGTDRLLGRGFARFDMRDPQKMFVRVKRETPGSSQAGPAQSGSAESGSAQAKEMTVEKAGIKTPAKSSADTKTI